MKRSLVIAVFIIGIVLTFFPLSIYSFDDNIADKVIDNYIHTYVKKNSFSINIPSEKLPSVDKQDKIIINEKIKKTARQLTENETSVIKKVYLLHQFVYENISYHEEPGTSSSFLTLETRQGDCLDKSILLSAMLSSLQIENYIIETKPEDFVNHAFVVVKIENKFFIVDPTDSFFNEKKYVFYEIYNKNFRAKF